MSASEVVGSPLDRISISQGSGIRGESDPSGGEGDPRARSPRLPSSLDGDGFGAMGIDVPSARLGGGASWRGWLHPSWASFCLPGLVGRDEGSRTFRELWLGRSDFGSMDGPLGGGASWRGWLHHSWDSSCPTGLAGREEGLRTFRELELGRSDFGAMDGPLGGGASWRGWLRHS